MCERPPRRFAPPLLYQKGRLLLYLLCFHLLRAASTFTRQFQIVAAGRTRPLIGDRVTTARVSLGGFESQVGARQLAILDFGRPLSCCNCTGHSSAGILKLERGCLFSTLCRYLGFPLSVNA